ncbi:13S globulin basic chain [Ananas comosus]|uniref:13S globulin basic chain n=1 Tax=Ananas comosus TaxID=4615 RepID=A0A199V040_ANACO|nr:13S globulin basic chain [Ananas comosus]
MGEVNEALKLLMVLLLLLASLCFVGVKGYVEELQDEEVVKERGGDEGEGGRRGLFMLGKAKKVVKTAGGEVRVVSGLRWKGEPNPMHIGFISMEPNTLFIPQYIDSDLVLFVKSGEAKVGWIYKDKMVEKHLKKGDVNVISAGSAFYVVNTGEGQKLHVICSIDTSESIGHGPYEGSMMAPHLNPQATEYGVVLCGSGTVQVVFPNGSTAMSAAVEEGDVFWVPRYFPFCQAASRRSGPMEFFGFTTSARRNRPQFLVGASSVLRSMRGPELAAAFDVGEEQLKEMVRAQREGVILPYSADQEDKKGEGEVDDMHGGFIIV